MHVYMYVCTSILWALRGGFVHQNFMYLQAVGGESLDTESQTRNSTLTTLITL